MKEKVIVFIVTFIALAFTLIGCMREYLGDDPQQLQSSKILLSMSGPTDFSTKSSAPVDKWDNTPVSVGYLFAPNTVFDKSLTVSVRDNTGAHINTGLEYPDDNSLVSFIGYHPVAEPNTVGTVTYDLSKGNVDVMVSNSVSGSLGNTIIEKGDKLVFEHKLTRVTFKLQCAQGQYYPEPIYGLRASASSTKLLNTAVTFDMATEVLTFKVAGLVFAGDLEGFVVPLFGNPAIIVEMMLQPDVPLAFTVSSLTGDRNITIRSDPDGLWEDLTKVGGKQGEQYMVELLFSGEMILAQKITVIQWINANGYLGDAQTWW